MIRLLSITFIDVYWWHWLALTLCCALSLRTPSVRVTAFLYAGAFFCAQFYIYDQGLDGQDLFLFAACAELAICSVAIWNNNKAAKIVACFSLVAAVFHAGIAAEYSWPAVFNLFQHKWVISGLEWGQIAALVAYSGPVYNWQLNRSLKREREKESVWLAYWAMR